MKTMNLTQEQKNTIMRAVADHLHDYDRPAVKKEHDFGEGTIHWQYHRADLVSHVIQEQLEALGYDLGTYEEDPYNLKRSCWYDTLRNAAAMCLHGVGSEGKYIAKKAKEMGMDKYLLVGAVCLAVTLRFVARSSNTDESDLDNLLAEADPPSGKTAG
jgi:hypothetical protein